MAAGIVGVFYKCPARPDGSGCQFWSWEEYYMDLVNKIAEEKNATSKVENVPVKGGRKEDEIVANNRALFALEKKL